MSCARTAVKAVTVCEPTGESTVRCVNHSGTLIGITPMTAVSYIKRDTHLRCKPLLKTCRRILTRRKGWTLKVFRNAANASVFSIIFSCWTRTLDLIGKHLRRARVPFARIDGKTPSGSRQSILDSFDSTRSVRVLIMTTGTGAFGYDAELLKDNQLTRLKVKPPISKPSIHCRAPVESQRGKPGRCSGYPSRSTPAGPGYSVSGR